MSDNPSIVLNPTLVNFNARLDEIAEIDSHDDQDVALLALFVDLLKTTKIVSDINQIKCNAESIVNLSSDEINGIVAKAKDAISPGIIQEGAQLDITSFDVMMKVVSTMGSMEPQGREQHDILEKLAAHIHTLKDPAEAVMLENEAFTHYRGRRSKFDGHMKNLKDKLFSNGTSKKVREVLDGYVFVGDLNKFCNLNSMKFKETSGFSNQYQCVDSDILKIALSAGGVKKVDALDFVPEHPQIFTEDDIVYANTWDSSKVSHGTEGDCSPWLDHWDYIGWSEFREHMLQWMAYTLKHPGTKINHMLVLGGLEGGGKDLIMSPLKRALGRRHSKTIKGHTLQSDFNDYLVRTKLLMLSEIENGDRPDCKVGNIIKDLAAAEPDTLMVNPKGTTGYEIRNIVSTCMTTNSKQPYKMTGVSRRTFFVWSDFDMREGGKQIAPIHRDYFTKLWTWMKAGGWEHCVWYLLNRVDLSNFNPGQAPIVTDAQMVAQESSKNTPQKALEELMERGNSVFCRDLLTSKEISDYVTEGLESDFSDDKDLFNALKKCTNSVVIGRILSQSGVPVMKRGRAPKRKDTQIWIIRNHSNYTKLSSSDLLDAYDYQLRKGKAALPPVKIAENVTEVCFF